MKRILALLLSLLIAFSLFACSGETDEKPSSDISSSSASTETDLLSLKYSGTPYYTLGKSSFTDKEKNSSSFEQYSPLDNLNRPGVAFALISIDIMPTEDREGIGQIKPAGWHTVKYDIVDGKYLYNRCHLIGLQLAGENANEKNLVTGTRYFNVDGMLPFENMVADYVKETKNRVLYRVTPIYNGDELLCRGVLIEAYSIEDRGEGIDFSVYVFNAQPGIEIDYKTGESRLSGSTVSSDKGGSEETYTFILNTNSKKFHLPNCSSVEKINEKNKEVYEGPISGLSEYSPCGACKPLEAQK